MTVYIVLATGKQNKIEITSRKNEVKNKQQQIQTCKIYKSLKTRFISLSGQ